MKKQTVAIMGATSHIAKGLISRFLTADDTSLVLFSRSATRIREFLSGSSAEIHEGYGDFNAGRYDVVINCVGTGAPNVLKGNSRKWFTLTEEFDNLALNYLNTVNGDALYVNFSSGAIYGINGSEFCGESTPAVLHPNHLIPADFYTVARLNSEAKHRSMKELRIADLRIFSYFSRYADPSLGYFMTDVLKALLSRTPLVTRANDMIRDYVDPDDLYALVRICMAQEAINTALDAYSAAPAGKFEILERFRREFGLEYITEQAPDRFVSPNGEKNIYCSKYHLAGTYGYSPRYTSLEGLVKETRECLKGADHGNFSA